MYAFLNWTNNIRHQLSPKRQLTKWPKSNVIRTTRLSAEDHVPEQAPSSFTEVPEIYEDHAFHGEYPTSHPYREITDRRDSLSQEPLQHGLSEFLGVPAELDMSPREMPEEVIERIPVTMDDATRDALIAVEKAGMNTDPLAIETRLFNIVYDHDRPVPEQELMDPADYLVEADPEPVEHDQLPDDPLQELDLEQRIDALSPDPFGLPGPL